MPKSHYFRNNEVQLITGFQQALNQQLNTRANDDVAINFTQIKFYILVVSGCMQLRLSVTFVNTPNEVCNLIYNCISICLRAVIYFKYSYMYM